jgi:hypothetical protein
MFRNQMMNRRKQRKGVLGVPVAAMPMATKNNRKKNGENAPKDLHFHVCFCSFGERERERESFPWKMRRN